MRALLALVVACAPAAAPVAPARPTSRPAPIEPRAEPAWIGVGMAASSTRIDRVLVDTPASRAGIRIGDEIASVDGHPVTDVRTFRAEVARHRIGDKVPMQIVRNGATLTVAVEIAELPDFEKIAVGQLAGKPAPPVALATLDGAPVATAGKVVVLDFWATWCRPCEIARPIIEELHAKHPDVAILGISDEDEATIRAYVGAHPIAYPLARDPDAQVARAYFVEGIPRVVLIDKAGVVRFVGLGVEGAAQLEAELAKLPR